MTLRGLLAACHPIPTIAVTTFVAAVTAATERPLSGCVLVVLAVASGQLSVGWCNETVDAFRDAETGRQDKPIPAGLVSRRTVTVAAATALAACVPLSLASGLSAGTVHLVGVLAGWGYNLGAKRTWLSWLPYAVGFGALTSFITLGLPGHPLPAWWGVSGAALLGVGAHFANVLPDIDADLRTGVRGLPQRLGERRARRILPVPLLVASLIVTLGPAGPPDRFDLAALIAATGLTLISASTAKKRSFLAAIAVAAIGTSGSSALRIQGPRWSCGQTVTWSRSRSVASSPPSVSHRHVRPGRGSREARRWPKFDIAARPTPKCPLTRCWCRWDVLGCCEWGGKRVR